MNVLLHAVNRQGFAFEFPREASQVSMELGFQIWMNQSGACFRAEDEVREKLTEGSIHFYVAPHTGLGNASLSYPQLALSTPSRANKKPRVPGAPAVGYMYYARLGGLNRSTTFFRSFYSLRFVGPYLL